MQANFISENLTVPKATVLGIEEEMSESVRNRINSRNESDSKRPSRAPRQENEALYRKLLQGKSDDWSPEDSNKSNPWY
jgi:hypothetical protein